MANIVGVAGPMGCGKTMLMTALGKEAHDRGRRIAANYALYGMDYNHVETIDDIKNLHDCLFLWDEVFVDLYARSSQRRVNQELTRIIMAARKRRVDMMFSVQLERTADVILREVTTSWLYPWIVPIIYNGERDYTVKFLEMDPLGAELDKRILTHNLDYWGQFYDTAEVVEQREEQHDNQMGHQAVEKGIELEKDNAKAAGKVDCITLVERIRESGRQYPKKWDLDQYTTLGINLAVDVKSSNQSRVNVWPEDARKQIAAAKKFGFIPFIAFPEYDKKQTTNPKFWYYHYLEGSYILGNRSRPAYPKLVQHSTRFTDLHTYLKKLQRELMQKNMAI